VRIQQQRVVRLDNGEVDVLHEMAKSHLWCRPGEIQGRPWNVNASLAKLARKGLLERQDRWRETAPRATWEYRMNEAGLAALEGAKAVGWRPWWGFGADQV